MYKQYFAGMEFTALPLFALFFFLVLFLAVGVRLFLVKRPKDFDRDASMPLSD
jgi:hypothetical protein